ncbi:diguanylate cyclase [Halanaerobium hydrogeniformans]|uniref:Diguanylate cyclase and metal dependent phosphohydrolase n=1 Tax=Halanaerobium hydrogeniformans TaxID=656519 RepID=E4RMH4_HALHG|nr:diguanylate cyclase [Halanaerobium hydrogeniformans]ADQ14505.1 diguanylate cyclase and metal dependent phosphohydrolase [Halanaerobium hydrogeniformans]
MIDKDILDDKLNLIEKNRIFLLVSHRENQNILKKYLMPEHEVITNNFSQNLEKIDLIIADEQGLQKFEEDIFEIKKTKSSFLYLPLLLITRIAIEDIPDKYLNIIDEIIEIPIEQRIFISRIKKLLGIRSMFLTVQIFQKLIDNNPAGICILLENREIKYVNDTFSSIIEKKKEDIINKNIVEVFPEDIIDQYFNKRKKIDKSRSTIELQLKDKHKWLDIQSIESKYKNIKLSSLIIIDMSERIEQQQEIEYLSYKDKLTDLYNRRFFEEEMERLDTERQLPISVIMADLNGLKLINDSYGHKKGDELLKRTAEILEKSIREEDILARQGGDEFAFLLPRTSKKQTEKILKRIREEIQKSEDKKFPISIALGTATKNKSEQNLADVLKKADDKMYQNKLSESRSSKSNIVQGLLNALAAKSHETKEHSDRMRKLALDFGESLVLSNSELNRLSLLARLHDIGKTNISEKILNKPAELNKEEWKIVKNHSEQGYKIALASEEFAVVAEDIFAHHENWDGSGYPRNLDGEDISYLARIISIIDAYDIMIHDLPYSKAISKEEALAEIKRCSGTQFDPELADKFIEFIKNN